LAGTSVGDLVYLSEQFEWTVRSVGPGFILPNVELCHFNRVVPRMSCGRLSGMLDSSARRFLDQPPSRRQFASLLLPRDRANSAAWLHTSHENGRRIGGNCVEAVRRTRAGRCNRGRFEESPSRVGVSHFGDLATAIIYRGRHHRRDKSIPISQRH
jgi:hypothetical protein